MKRLMIVPAALCLMVAGCGSNSSTSPTATNLAIFTVTMLPSNEVPPVTNAESSARGTAVITIHKDTNVIDFAVNVSGFPAGAAFNNAHIHSAAAGVPGGVFIPSGLAASDFPAITNGSATFTFSVTSAGADKVSQVLANPAGFYFNLHTVANPGGVMRGQLQ
jgi:CHRD domain-containing protein